MLTNNKYVTIYNKKNQGRSTLWFKTIIHGVNIHSTVKSTVGDKELKTANEHIIRIPERAYSENKNYIDPLTFKGLSFEEIDNCFTIQNGDLIVEGVIDDDIQSSSELLQKYDVMVVVSATNNLSASPYSRHIKVVCK